MSEEFDNVVYQEPQSNGGGSNGMAIASMVCGIVGLVLACCISGWIGLILGIVALVLGILHNKNNGKSGMATAGIVCGIIAIALGLVSVIITVIFGAALTEAISSLAELGM